MTRIVLCLGIVLQIASTVQDNQERQHSMDKSIEYDNEELSTSTQGYLNMSNSIAIAKRSNRTYIPACEAESWDPYMKLSLVPIIAVVGLVGNTLAFIVLCSPVFSRKSYSHYLQSLAVFDTLTLLLITIRECDDICRALRGSDMCVYRWLLRDTVSCKIWELFRHVVYLMSSWLVVCFTIDRCVAVCLPLVHRNLTETRSKFIILLLIALATLTQLFRLWYVEYVPGRAQPCHVPLEYVEKMLKKIPTNESMTRRLTYMKVDTFAFAFGFRFLLPCIIIAVCNGYIIFHIVRVRSGLPARERKKSRYANMAVTTLFGVCIIFVLCLLPNALLEIIMHTTFTPRTVIGFPRIFCILLSMDGPFKMIRMLNYAINFVLYGLTGRQFRREFFRLLRGKSRLPFDGRLLFRFTGTDRNVA